MHFRILAVVDGGDVASLSGGMLDWPHLPLAALYTEGSPFPGRQCRKRCSLGTCAFGRGEGAVTPS